MNIKASQCDNCSTTYWDATIGFHACDAIDKATFESEITAKECEEYITDKKPCPYRKGEVVVQ